MNQTLAAATILLLAGSAGAAELRLLAPAAGDLAPNSLTRNTTKALAANIERAPIAVSWAIEASEPLAYHRPSPELSKEYWVEASAAELTRGFDVFTTAPGALIRINPVEPGQKSAAIAPGELSIRTASGQELTGDAAFSLAVDSAVLKEAGAGFAEGTVAFRLAPAVGDGVISVRATSANATRGYVVHVLDQASDVSLGAATASYDVVAGDKLRVRAGVERAGRSLDATVAGFVTSPDGQVFELDFATGRAGVALAQLTLENCAVARPGLWEFHASARAEVDGKVALRTVRTAFACAEATARLTGEATLDQMSTNALVARLGVETAVAGRYEVRGVLFGTNGAGQLVPGAVAHSAAWLEAGSGDIRLMVDAETLATAGLSAPFEVRDLTLIDQGRLGVLHRQARGLEITP